ncbi:MAG: SCO family protein [Hyphomicrobiaceae bacterium]|nr:SCO family protein [Hyphomicrobiaceae bacterium]
MKKPKKPLPQPVKSAPSLLRTVRLTAWVAVLAVAFVAGVMWMSNLLNRDLSGTGGARPAAIGIGGAFTLTDTNGKRVSEADLAGRPTVLFFGYTFCPDVCPTTLTEATQWLTALGKDADKLRVVFVSVDPGRDTPETLKTYLTAFDPRIQGWSGTEAEIAQLKTAYRVFVRKVERPGGEYLIDHTATVYLLDASGTFAGTIAYGEATDTAMAKLKRLIGGA